MPIHQGRGPRYGLLLHPAEPAAEIPSSGAIATVLARLGLVGEGFTCGSERYLMPGPRLLELITFLGCSPFVSLDPPAGTNPCKSLDQFCAVAIQGTGGTVVLRRAEGAPTPRCPACRSSAADWETLAREAGTAAATSPWTCPRCGVTSRLAHLDWRQSAGFATTFVEIWGVHPGEAVPGDELLASLASITGCPWRWFYLTASVSGPPFSHMA